MNMFEEARAIAGMMRMRGITQADMARSLGVSQSYVANKVRLLSLSPEMMKRIDEAGLTERHARAVLRLRDESLRTRALDRIISEGLTVRESEALVDLLFEEDAYRTEFTRGRAYDAIASFKAGLSRSISTLVSQGVSASESLSYYGNRTYITIVIEE